jgi:hypothetical protein
MLPLLQTLLVLGLVLTAVFLIPALLRSGVRHRPHCLSISETEDGRANLRTELGVYQFRPDAREISVRTREHAERIPYDDVAGFEYRHRSQYAMAQEMVFGFDLSDLLGRYSDTIEWYLLSLRTRDRRLIPVFVVGEYQRREFLVNVFQHAEEEAMRGLGLPPDGAAQGRRSVDVVLALARRCGLDVDLV